MQTVLIMSAGVLATLADATATPSPESTSRPPIEAPVGGKTFAAPEGVFCSPPSGNWAVAKGGRAVIPPASGSEIGTTAILSMAASSEQCGEHAWQQRLIARLRGPCSMQQQRSRGSMKVVWKCEA